MMQDVEMKSVTADLNKTFNESIVGLGNDSLKRTLLDDDKYAKLSD